MTKYTITIEAFVDKIPNNTTVFTGYIPENIKIIVENKHIKLIDMMKNQNNILFNSYLTAEGLLSNIIQVVPFSLISANILILGYGNCGYRIAEIFSNLCNEIYIYDKDTSKYKETKATNIFPISNIQSSLENTNIIINTVPHAIIENTLYKYMSSDFYIFDIASTKNNFDSSQIKKHNINYNTCPGIPGRYSPKSAGEILAKYIINHLEGNE
jgi:dipicolinate synthase subunit A